MASKSALFERLTLHAPHLSTRQVMPAFLYGTAWKKETTSDLVYEALKNGFTGLDTACQPKHYREDLVGEGLRRAIKEKVIRREEVFVQTKFTSVDGQDPQNVPYDPTDSLVEQVRRSVEKSLQNFDVAHESLETTGRSTYLDSVVLHSPLRSFEQTIEVWRTLESYVPSKILNLGISNVGMPTLHKLYEQAVIKPSIVQNRFYPATKYDIDIRRFCRERNIVYQSFWTISANPQLLRSVLVGLEQ